MPSRELYVNVVSPTPREMVKTAIEDSPGVLRSMRAPKRRSANSVVIGSPVRGSA